MQAHTQQEQTQSDALKRAHPDAWQHGYNSGAIAFSYIDPAYTIEQMQAWALGYTAGKASKQSQGA